MADDAELDLLRGLLSDLRKAQPAVKKADMYYEGEQPLRFMAPVLEAELGDRISQVLVNFPRLAVEAYEHRLDVEGFRSSKKTLNRRMEEWWEAAGGPELSQLGHQESIALGRSYAMVGAGDDGDLPVLSIESPEEVITRWDPRTRKTTSAVKVWGEKSDMHAELFLPDVTISFDRVKGKWEDVARDEHGLGEVMVYPLVNHPRIRRPLGRAEFADIIPVADAVNKMATDMMIAGEFHAMPRRYAIGFEEGDFVDSKTGRALTQWEQIAGRVWTTAAKPDEVSVGQFPEANLENFFGAIRLLSQLIGILLALPPDYVAFTTINPPSAEGMRAAETRTIKRAERKQRVLDSTWERVQRGAMRIITGRWEPLTNRIETIWRDPATPTHAQAADAAMKLVSSQIIPRQQAWEDLHYTPEQQARMKQWITEESQLDMMALAALGAGGVKPEIDAED